MKISHVYPYRINFTNITCFSCRIIFKRKKGSYCGGGRLWGPAVKIYSPEFRAGVKQSFLSEKFYKLFAGIGVRAAGANTSWNQATTRIKTFADITGKTTKHTERGEIIINSIPVAEIAVHVS